MLIEITLKMLKCFYLKNRGVLGVLLKGKQKEKK